MRHLGLGICAILCTLYFHVVLFTSSDSSNLLLSSRLFTARKFYLLNCSVYSSIFMWHSVTGSKTSASGRVWSGHGSKVQTRFYLWCEYPQQWKFQHEPWLLGRWCGNFNSKSRVYITQHICMYFTFILWKNYFFQYSDTVGWATERASSSSNSRKWRCWYTLEWWTINRMK